MHTMHLAAVRRYTFQKHPCSPAKNEIQNQAMTTSGSGTTPAQWAGLRALIQVGCSATVDYTTFAAGAQTQWNGDESSCTGGCSGFASANANWLRSQLVGNGMENGLGGYIQFMANRTQALSTFSQIAYGPLD